MLHRLLVPLAIRSLFVAVVIAVFLCLLLVPAEFVQGGPNVAATLGESSAPFVWSGQPAESNDYFDQAACLETQSCDVFRVKVDVSNQYRQSHPNFALAVRVGWEGSQNDFDLYLMRDGRVIKRSSRWHTDFEEVHLLKPANGLYEIYVHAAGVEPATPYKAQAKIMEETVNLGADR